VTFISHPNYRDLILASSEVCSCSEVGGGAAAAVSKESFQYSDDKHPVIEFERQIEILAIIMIPLLTSRAETKRMKTSSCKPLYIHFITNKQSNLSQFV